MATNTILLLLSLLVSSSLSYIQYFYKVEIKNKLNLILAFFRFLSLFGLFLLLINPIITKKNFEIVKTPLPIIIDNSSSIANLNSTKQALSLYKNLTKNKDLKEKFSIQTYQFDNEFKSATNLNFKGTQTNIDEVAIGLKSIYKNIKYPIILITDGNQTSGNDYVYSFKENNTIYPVAIGDTIPLLDLKINQINVNKYAYHKNKFPVEVFLSYSGKKNINANFSISQSNSIISKKKISFSPQKKSIVLKLLLPAVNLGLQTFKANISCTEFEKNTHNNKKSFLVDIINQKLEIAIISTINHPDIGVLKRAIETNFSRKVSVLNPKEIKNIDKYKILILYQPNEEFKTVFNLNKVAYKNIFVITGKSTNFNFLNQEQTNFNFRMGGDNENYSAMFNPQFNLFLMDNFGLENFPSLENPYGTIYTKENISILLYSKIRNTNTGLPLLTFIENQENRTAFLFGENIWKWRLQSHIETTSHEKFDLFVDKIIQFLTSKKIKKSLAVNHEKIYNLGENIEISAQYFNKNYEFDHNTHLSILITHKKTKQKKNYELIKANNYFKVNLNGLLAGDYTFSIREQNSNTTYASEFQISNFDIEKQFINPDVQKLKQLALQTKGNFYYPNQNKLLINKLLKDQKYKPIQKSIVQKIPLIEWEWLLILISLFLTIEWFIRKYNGML